MQEDLRILDEIENDTTSFFSLLDSLINIKIPSVLSAYSNYSSKVLYSGRDYGIDQYGLTAGLSFFHKSGMFASVSGNYFSGITPEYNSTNLSLGYSDFLKPKWYYTVSYEHTFFNTIDETADFDYTLNNSLRLMNNLSFSFFDIGVEGAMYFGNGSRSFRLIPQLTLKPKIKTKGFLSKLTLNPIVTLPIMDETFYATSIRYYTARRIIHRIGRYRFIRLYNRDDSRLRDLLYTDTLDSQWTLANISVAFPLRFTHKKWTCSLTYNLNLPVELPGETLEVSTNDFVSMSISYSLGL